MRLSRLSLVQSLLTRASAKEVRLSTEALYRFYHSKTEQNQQRQQNRQSRKNLYLSTALGALGLVGSAALYRNLYDSSNEDEVSLNRSKDENVYTRNEVAAHDSLEKGVWIIYKGHVYDITAFIKHHPGGSHTILMGAGGDVEPFWQTYTVHQASEVQNLLVSYKIGRLSEEEKVELSAVREVSEGPYANDPKRSRLLEVLTKEPFNAETPSRLLVQTYLTPTELFFVRNHLPVPEIDLNDYSLSICIGTDGDQDGLNKIAEFTLDELKSKFEPHTIDCVIQCSGNRRSDLKQIKEIKGLGWKVGAISNARWTGVRLVDLLKSIGLKQGESVKHVQLEGLDCDMSGQAYRASISADVAFDPKREVLLAYEMNGQPLSRDHGFPLRFVAAGITGARNVKWLSKIILSEEESNSHWQRNDYKSFSPNVDMFNLDYGQSISIQEMPVQSAICEPNDGQKLSLSILQDEKSPLFVPVKGYAYSGGGKMIVRVDVSIDGGSTWITADLIDSPKKADGSPDYTNRNHVWCWTRWSVDVPVPDELMKAKKGSLEILCRAFDSSYNSQPERAETVWNVRGVVNNSWHKIKLDLQIN